MFAERKGQPSLRLMDPSLARPDEPHAVRRGINVHAKLSVGGNDRAQLERLCRYLGRPPIAQQRLERLADGRLRYEFKKAWKDGTRALVLDPLDLIARVVAMIPAPGFHMVRYHGVLSSHSNLRRLVVPTQPASVQNPLLPERSGQLGFSFESGADAGRAPARRKPWACSRCIHHLRQANAADILDAFFSEHLIGRIADPRLTQSLAAIFASKGQATVADLARAAATTERTLRRMFEKHVGLTPKRFARVVRIQTVLRRAEAEPDWARLAGELGYADQSHLIREMHTLFGDTPTGMLGGRLAPG